MSKLRKQAFKNPIRAVATVLTLVSTRNYSKERVDMAKTCLKQQWIPYRTVGGSVQVRESVLDTARIQCLW